MSHEKIRKGEGEWGKLLFAFQASAMCKFPDSDLNELINIVDSTKHNQTLLIHSKKNRDHLFWICAIFLTTVHDVNDVNDDQ